MGRPRKDGATQKVRERLISAMADRLIREPVDAVTVTSLIKEVGCNRSTFYYYFADTEQLAEGRRLMRWCLWKFLRHCSRSSEQGANLA